MALLSKPGLIPLKVENNGTLITTQVNKINFVGAVSCSIGNFNDLILQIGLAPSASYAFFAVSSSYASSSTSASYALTASYVANASSFPYTGSALITGSLGITGSLSQSGSTNIFLQGLINQTTATTHVVTFNNATGQLFITASSAFGGGGGGGAPGGATNTIQFNNAGTFSGSNNFTLVGGNTVSLTGSLLVTGSSRFIGPITGSSFTGSFTGSLFGTSSWAVSASQAISSSYALSSSFAISSSYALSSSFTISSSYAANGGVTQLLAGANISLSPTNGLGQVTITSTGGSGGTGNTATGSYGSFYDTTTQTNPVANVPRSMSLNTTAITNGVAISGSTSPFNTYIKTENAGVYDIQFSAQLDKTDSGTDEIIIWLRKNGSDLTDTATTVTLAGNNAKNVAAWNWFVNSAANDYYQIIWQSADTDVRLFASLPAGGHPGIPSVIVTANRVDQFLSNTGSFSGSFIGLFSGSFTGSLFGTSSWSSNAVTASFVTTAQTASFVTTAQTASYVLQSVSASFATSASTVYIASNSGTDANYTLIFKNNAGALDNYYQLAADGTNGPYYNPSTNILGGVGGITISGSVGRFTSITGSSITSSFTGSLLGTASFATTASYVLSAQSFPYTGSAIITGSLGVTGSINQADDLGGLSITQEIINSSIPLGLNAVVTKTISGPASMFLDYQIISGSNQRTGTIIANFNFLGTPTSTYYETVTADIGNTSVISFSSNGTPPYTIQANNSGPNPYTFKAILH
jgi:hypothetical protein